MATSVTFDLFARDHASGAFVKVGQAAQQAGKQVDGLGKRAEGLSGHFTAVSRVGPRAFGVLATGAKAVALGLAGAAGAAGLFGLKTASNMEQARISFTTMLGSAQKADKFLRELQKFAAATPFEFPELQTAASSLISAGINANKVIPIMRTLGDVTSGMGTGSEGVRRATIALQQMSAAGRITGEDLNQLRDAGVPVFDLLAAATGKSKAQVVALAQAGKLGGKELGQLMKALETGKGLERFSGLMEKQSHSLAGLFSTLKDNVGQSLSNLITPAIPAIKAGLEGLSSLTAAAAPKIQAAFALAARGVKLLRAGFLDGETDGAGFVGVMQRIGDTAYQVFNFFQTSVLPRIKAFGSFLRDDAVPALVSFGGWLAKNRAWLIPIAAGIGAIIAAVKIWTAVSRAFAVVQGIVNVILAANPIGIVVLAIAGLVAAFVVAYRTSDTFRAIVQKAWAGIQVAASFAWNNVLKPVFSALNTFVRSVLAPTVLWLWQNVFGPAFRGIATVVQVIWPIVRGIFQTWWAFIRNVLAPVFMWVWRNVVTPAFNGIRDKIATVWAVVRPILTTIGSFIRDKVAPAFSAGVTAIGRAWDRIKAIATTPVNFIIGTVLNKGIFAAYNWIVSKFGGTKIPNLPLVGQGGGGGGGGGAPRKFAEGGPIRGPGTGRSDSIAAWLSNGEHVWTADEVKKAGGHRAVEQMRQRVARYADGGAVDAGIKAGLSSAFGIVSGNKVINPVDYLRGKITGALRGIGGSDFARMLATIPRRIGAMLVDKVRQLFSGGGPMGSGGVMGYQNQMTVLRRAFPGLALISGFRPGAITATGNRSYHSMGRAVDVPPRMDVFNWIRANYGARTKELIFSPAGNNQVWNGRPHWYSEPTRGDHWDHVHWAMANGGVIREPVHGIGQRTGATYSFAERGPETVTPGVGGLTEEQMQRAFVAALRSVGMTGGSVGREIGLTMSKFVPGGGRR